jgi:hypothetical protein
MYVMALSLSFALAPDPARGFGPQPPRRPLRS